ncbi:MAG: manganese efflux pump [Chloroflexi bacterium]|nr:manganese efflux pump [Chloroflexota bacterium]
MDFVSILVIALGLSADCFAVALGISITRQSRLREALAVALSFGLAQALMPAIGYLAGRALTDIIAGYDHWVAFGLLGLIGGRMVWNAFHEKAERPVARLGIVVLLTLAVATSIDSLAAGLTFAFLRMNIWLASGVIGATAFVVSASGFVIGRRAGDWLGRRAELAGGIILIGIGLRILLDHLLD